MRKPFVLSLLIICLSIGCVGVVDGPVPDRSRPAAVDMVTGADPARYGIVRVWIEDHVYLPKADTMEGCNFWLAKGHQCIIVPKEEADIEVYVNMQDCVADEKGNFPPSGLAYIRQETNTGIITFWPRCSDDDATGKVDRAYYIALMAHEFGHELGMWNHVSDTCDASMAKWPIPTVDGIRVCGPAIMNSYVGARKLTQMDLLFYEARTDVTVIKGDVTTTRHALTAAGSDPAHECAIPHL